MVTLKKITQWFGLDLHFYDVNQIPNPAVGFPVDAYVSFDLEGGLWVSTWALSPKSVTVALHECIHAVLGAKTLESEAGFTAYEFFCAKKIFNKKEYQSWRRDFQYAPFDWTNVHGEICDGIGDTDEVFSSREWAEECETATKAGWLVRKQPVRFRGIHSSFTREHLDQA